MEDLGIQRLSAAQGKARPPPPGAPVHGGRRASALQAEQTARQGTHRAPRHLLAQRRDHPALDPSWRDRDHLEEALRFGERRATRARTASETLVGDTRIVAGKRFGDKEGIAAGGGVQFSGWTMGLLRQSVYRGFREREQAQPGDVTGGQITQDET